MSTTLLEKDGLTVTRFWGGAERKSCVQINVDDAGNAIGGYVQLTRAQVGDLYTTLRKFMFAVDNGR